MRSGSSAHLRQRHFAREALAPRWLRPPGVARRDGDGARRRGVLLLHDRSHRRPQGASTRSRSPKTPSQSSHSGHRRRRLGNIDPRHGEAQVAETTIRYAAWPPRRQAARRRRQDLLAPHPPASAPSAEPQLTGVTPLLRHRSSRPRTKCRRRLPRGPRHRRARHVASKTRAGLSRSPLRTVPAPTAPGSPACSRTRPRRLVGRAHPMHAPAHRGAHHRTGGSPHPGPPRQPQRPPQAPPADKSTAMGKTLQPPSLGQLPPTASAPGAAQPHPTRHQPHQPRNPVPARPERHAPARSTPPAQRPPVS